jgi:hypothetical protein
MRNFLSLIREACKLRVFESRVLRKIFGPEMYEAIGWRQLHNGELHNWYSSPNTCIIRAIKPWRIRWAGHISHTGAKRNVGMAKPEAKRPL